MNAPARASATRARTAALLAAVAVVAGGVAWLVARSSGPGETDRERLTREVEAIRADLARTTRERFAEFGRELDARKAAIDRAAAEREPSERERFARWLERYRASVLLLAVEATVEFPRAGREVSFGAFGTGWVADASGLVVTNKHVVQPWKFEPELQALLEQEGDAVVRTRLHAWSPGERFETAAGTFDDTVGFHSSAGTLRLLAVPPDDWTGVEVDVGGRRATPRVHAHTDADLAVLEATGRTLPALPLRARPQDLTGLEPVMLLGFPLGPTVLEAGTTDLSPSLGTIRFVRETVGHTAPAFPGNSGGPLLGIDGEVVGVLTRGPGDATTLTQAIRSDVVRTVLAFARLAAASPDDGGQVRVVREESLLDVTSSRSGRVERLPHEPGEEVAAGATLAEFDRRRSEADLQQFQAELDVARADVAAADAKLARNREPRLRAPLEAAAEAARSRLENLQRLVDVFGAIDDPGKATAPRPGLLADVAVEVGEVVTEGSRLATLARAQDVEKDWKAADAVAPGRRVALLAEPRAGWRFAGWSDGATSRSRVVTVSEGLRLEARFEEVRP